MTAKLSKYFSILGSFSFKLLRQNLVNLFTYDFRIKFDALYSENYVLSSKLRHLQYELLYYKILDHYKKSPDQKYEDELSYLSTLGAVSVFPYKQNKYLQEVVSCYDQVKEMPYVIHSNGKKLYFPKSWSVENAKAQYINFIEKENILGGGYLEKCPHQYLTETFSVKATDIVLDVGAAEGLFALDIVDKVKKIYVFESEAEWLEPLKATFDVYNDKVIIINKFVSDKNSATEITLSSCLQNEQIESIFIKLDIEGEERKVLEASKDMLSQNLDIRIACCTYHRENDADNTKKVFEQLGYTTEFSDGYMIFLYDDQIKAPYFRHGLIRAKCPQIVQKPKLEW